MVSYLGTDYISVGGNRHSAAADWSRNSGVVAFGADQNVALWYPTDLSQQGVSSLLTGHGSKVNAVKFLSPAANNEVLVTGSADGELRLWKQSNSSREWMVFATTTAHAGAINTIATLDHTSYFVTGGADATVKLWILENDQISFLSSIVLKPRFIPLTTALGSFQVALDALLLVVGGTRNEIQVFSIQHLHSKPISALCATLTGHEGWIRSLSIREGDDSNLLLASASHDKYVRLWRFQSGKTGTKKEVKDPNEMVAFEKTLTGKVQTVSVEGAEYSISFEALLLGHEDWIYTAIWNPDPLISQLLTSSADGSITIWEPDESSGVWVSASRLGEISGQKGATTATGSAGGFWIGLWSPDGKSVTCLSRTGSWRMWNYDHELQFWIQKVSISGHTSPVNGISWSTRGDYLLSTSSDQTTRLHAEWKRGNKRSWHEFARPQIHGYDLNCVTATKGHQFVSGADEKLLRVFDEPQAIADMLCRLCNIKEDSDSALPQTAAIPVLGLSNKAVDSAENTESGGGEEFTDQAPSAETISATILELQTPPTEDLLSRHTLWPEHEKLYGHGYEISEAATSTNGKILATACKASSLDHAVIRLYDTTDWHEIRPALSAHSLTVTRLSWSNTEDDYLLSVGRDRQWTVFRPSQQSSQTWEVMQSYPRAHSRMILDAAWSPVASRLFFATGGRDKNVIIWERNPEDANSKFEPKTTISRKSAVTAVAISHVVKEDSVCIAIGEEDGTISLHLLNIEKAFSPGMVFNLDSDACPSKAITRLSWRSNDRARNGDSQESQLAVGSVDCSLRILRVNIG